MPDDGTVLRPQASRLAAQPNRLGDPPPSNTPSGATGCRADRRFDPGPPSCGMSPPGLGALPKAPCFGPSTKLRRPLTSPSRPVRLTSSADATRASAGLAPDPYWPGAAYPVATLRASLEGLTRGSAPSTPKGPAPRRAGSQATGFDAMANRGFADRRGTAMGAYAVPEAARSSAAPKPARKPRGS